VRDHVSQKTCSRPIGLFEMTGAHNILLHSGHFRFGM